MSAVPAACFDAHGSDKALLDCEPFLDLIFDGAFVVNRDLEITCWNKAAERITGFRREEVVGVPCFRDVLVHVDARGESSCGDCALGSTLKDGRVREDFGFLRHRAGHRLPVMIRTAPIKDHESQIVGAIEFFSSQMPAAATAERVAELERLAMLDALTELPNRRFLEMTLTSRLSEWERFSRPFGVLLIDIDKFKLVNDDHGHAVGDHALQMVAKTLQKSARAVDIVGRWGGEEFLALVTEVDGDNLFDIGERLRSLVQASELSLPEGKVRLTVSVGAAMVAQGDTGDELLRRADDRLYQAKRSGRNSVIGPPPQE